MTKKIKSGKKPEKKFKFSGLKKNINFPVKKILIISALVSALLLAGYIVFMLFSEQMLFQSPAVVLKKPKVTFIMGRSEYRTNEKAQWKKISLGTTFRQGYEIRTGPDSFLDLRFHEGTTIRVGKNTHMKIRNLVVNRMFLDFYSGSVYGRFKKLITVHDFIIKTCTSIISIRGTELGVELQDKSDKKAALTKVYCLSGIIEVENPLFKNQQVLLSNGSRLSIDENNPPSNPEKMNEDETEKLETMMNSIHDQEVLLISDKIYFESGSARILPSSYPELDKIAGLLKYREMTVGIEGHTDNTGPASVNQVLSRDRAVSIRDYLVKKGFPPGNFIIKGFGSSKPIDNNKTEQGRAHNRRVEFIVID